MKLFSWEIARRKQAPQAPDPASRERSMREAAFLRGKAEGQRMNRGYDAGTINRLDADWNPVDGTADQAWLHSFPRLRSRARDLVMNDGYGERYIMLNRLNVAGPDGFKFQMDVRNDNAEKTKDVQANIKIEEAFKDWCKRDNCTVTGSMSFRKVQQIVTECLKRDGEILVVKVYNESKYGFQLQVLEVDLLDERRNVRLDNGNVICLGVEMNKDRKPVAYWIRPSERVRDLLTTGRMIGESIRIPAEFVYHRFDTRRPFMTRGASHMAPSMRRMRTMHGFEEAYTEKARATAQTVASIEQIDKDAPDPAAADSVTKRDEPQLTMESGMVSKLPWGYKLSSFDPDFPSEAYGPFLKGALRGIASGWGLGYNIFGNDLEGVSYSSIRAGVLDEREYWKDTQALITEEFLEPVFSDWLRAQLLSQKIALPMSKFDKFNQPLFTGRRWPWVDPLKDIQAAKEEIQMGGSTLTKFLAEKGEDIADILRERAEEIKMAKDLGITLSIDVLTGKAAVQPAKEESGEEKPVDEGRVVDEWSELLLRYKDGSSTPDDDENAAALINRLLLELRTLRNGHNKKEKVTHDS